MMQKITIKKDANEIALAMAFLDKAFLERKTLRKDAVRSKLAAEEIISTMIRHADEDAEITIGARNELNGLKLYFRSKGKEFSAEDIEKCLLFTSDESNDEEVNDVLHQMFRKIFSNDFSIRNTKGINKATLTVHTSPYANLIATLSMALLGVLTGLIMQLYLPAALSTFLTNNIFIPIYTMFMNALKMIVGPLVFCSIASSIADFGNLRALGKIAGRTVILYLLTSLFAITVGLITYHIFPIGDPNLALSVTDAADATIGKGSELNISIKDTLVNIVPTNIVTPFLNSDMMQIIFMAVALGMAASAVSEKTSMLTELLFTMNAALSRITTAIINGIPIIVFCSMAKMMATMNLFHLLHVITWVPTIYFGDMLMICVYCILLIVFARLNPLIFLRKYFPAMVNAFILTSSNAALPSSMKQCDELGVAKKLYSFTLPLGATINMDGSSVTLMITSLFFAKIFGIPITANVLLSLFIAIMVLSVGSPGVPGGVLVCITILIPEIGIPAEATSLIMGLYPLVSMMQTCVNVTGDAVVSMIVAKNDNKLDIAKYYS